MPLKKLSLLAVAVAMSVSTHAADNLAQSRVINQTLTANAAASQNRVDQSAEQALLMQADIERLQEEVENLAIYRGHLANLVDNQQQELVSLQTQLQGIESTRQGIVPLMYNMLAELETIIANDQPIKHQQRGERLARLKALMSQADVSDAEKYRQILEAYQIEMDYGTKLGVYQGEIDISAGVDSNVATQTLTVELSHLGRVALLARSFDGQSYWQWLPHQQRWLTITTATADIDTAYKVAKKQLAPQLLTLPVALQPITTDSKRIAPQPAERSSL